jgi:hypothetical protein
MNDDPTSQTIAQQSRFANDAKHGWYLFTLAAMTLVLLAIGIENGTQIETLERAVCSAATDKGLAVQLRAEIDKRYKELIGAHALSGRPNGNDITDAVLPFLHPGRSFNDSEKILRCAGFTITYPDPTTPKGSRFKEWYTVLAIAPYVRSRFFGCAVDIRVWLVPPNPGEYTSIEMVRADILVRCLWGKQLGSSDQFSGPARPLGGRICHAGFAFYLRAKTGRSNLKMFRIAAKRK